MQQDVNVERDLGIVRLRLQLQEMRHEISVCLLKHCDELKGLAGQAVKDAIDALPQHVEQMAADIIAEQMRNCIERSVVNALDAPEVLGQISLLVRTNLQKAVDAILGEE